MYDGWALPLLAKMLTPFRRIVLMSTIILGKRYTAQQFIAVLLTIVGCVCAKLDALLVAADDERYISLFGIALIAFQSLLSSVAAVWIEARMKEPARFCVSVDASTHNLYYFLGDSIQLYAFGIPLYAFEVWRTYGDTFALPLAWSVAFVTLIAALGLALGAVFVFYSSVERSMVAAATLVSVVVVSCNMRPLVLVGAGLVVAGIFLWTKAKTSTHSITGTTTVAVSKPSLSTDHAKKTSHNVPINCKCCHPLYLFFLTCYPLPVYMTDVFSSHVFTILRVGLVHERFERV